MPRHDCLPARRLLMILGASLLVGAGCHQQAPKAVTQPSETADSREDPPPHSRPDLSGARADASATPLPTAPREQATSPPAPEPRKPRKPKRPVDTWVILREVVEPDRDASWKVEWTGGNRLEVHTENISRLTINLTELPLGAPKKGPWNLQIDGQGIEMTGFRPKPGYTGKIRDLVRSQNGDWTVDRRALYRIGG